MDIQAHYYGLFHAADEWSRIGRSNKKKLVNAPTIIMTGNHDSGLLSGIKASGLIASVLLKPINLETLREKIETITRHSLVSWVS